MSGSVMYVLVVCCIKGREKQTGNEESVHFYFGYICVFFITASLTAPCSAQTVTL